MEETIGYVIRKTRKSLGVSAAALGSRLEPPVTHAAVCAWETGKSEPNINYISQISDILSVDFSGFVGAKEFISDGLAQIVNSYEKMSEEQKAAILVVARSMVD